MNDFLLGSLIFILGVFVSSVSQIILKKSTEREYSSPIREYLNVRVLTAYFIFFTATLCSVFAYRYIPLSLGPILESAGYIFVFILGYIFLHEKVSKRKIIGLVTILIGIIVFSI